MYISIFEGFDNPVEQKFCPEIISDIRSDKYKNDIKEIRRLLAEGEEAAAKEKKQQLPAFTASGKFIGGRKKQHLAAYSYFVMQDFDNVSYPEFYVKLATADPYTYACFISPSGNGFKIIVRVSSEAQYHEQAFNQVREHYENSLHCKADRKCKDISRLCFVSYDPDAYINENAKTFLVHTILPKEDTSKNATRQANTKNNPSNKNLKYSKDFERCKLFTDKLQPYEEGNRNNYIHSLACNANRWGIPEKEALNFILKEFDLDPTEIKSCVKSAYNNKADFGLISKGNSSIEGVQVEEDPLLKMPYIPEEIFSTLPPVLRSGSDFFPSRRQRDVFLTSAIGVFSGCFHTVEGIYDQGSKCKFVHVCYSSASKRQKCVEVCQEAWKRLS